MIVERAHTRPPELRRRQAMRDSHSLSLISATPVYQLRAFGLGGGEMLLEIWQLPSPATPRLTEPEYTAGIRGRPLRLLESRILKRLRAGGVSLASLKKDDERRSELDEDLALNLALLFRALAPMRSIDRIQAVADGIDRMSPEEASYWLGMALNRKQPRRVLAALRMLLTTP